MTHHYSQGTLVFSNRKASVKDVAFTIIEGKRHCRHHSDFLNGRYEVSGTLVEECSPNDSRIARERVAKLHIGESLLCGTVLDLLFLEIEKVTTMPNWRAYLWSFGVVNCRYDRLNLFSNIESIDINDLILSLGVVSDITTNVVFDNEGGFSGFNDGTIQKEPHLPEL